MLTAQRTKVPVWQDFEVRKFGTCFRFQENMDQEMKELFEQFMEFCARRSESNPARPRTFEDREPAADEISEDSNLGGM